MSTVQMPNLEAKSEFLTAKDLVELGLFKTTDAVYLARRRGISPRYIKMGSKILYPKSCVQEFVQSCLKEVAAVPKLITTEGDIDTYYEG